MDKHSENDQTEVSLVDIGVMFWQYRWVFAGVWMVFTLLGVVIAAVTPPSYRYSTVIQIGGTPGPNGEIHLFESVDTVAAKFRSVFIPELIVRNEQQTALARLDVDVSVPKGAAAVELAAKGPLDLSGIYVVLLKDLAAKMSADHQRILKVQESRLNADRSALMAKRADFAARREATAEELQRIADTRALLAEQVKTLNSVIFEYQSQASAVGANGDVSSKALTLLLLNDSIEDAMRNRLELEERIQSDLPNRASELEAALATLAAQIDMVDAEIARVDASIEGLRKTKAIAEPIVSREPVGFYGLKMVAVFFGAGVFAAGFSVLVFAYICVVRKALFMH